MSRVALLVFFRFVVLDGFFARVEEKQGDRVTFLRIDEQSEAERLEESLEHVQARHEAGEELAAHQMWMVEPMVRLTALRWDAKRKALRLKLERVRLSQSRATKLAAYYRRRFRLRSAPVGASDLQRRLRLSNDRWLELSTRA